MEVVPNWFRINDRWAKRALGSSIHCMYVLWLKSVCPHTKPLPAHAESVQCPLGHPRREHAQTCAIAPLLCSNFQVFMFFFRKKLTIPSFLWPEVPKIRRFCASYCQTSSYSERSKGSHISNFCYQSLSTPLPEGRCTRLEWKCWSAIYEHGLPERWCAHL